MSGHSKPSSMRFGVFLMQYATPSTQATLFGDLVEQVKLMEKLGYYSALLGERHLYRDGWLELQCVLAALATQTRKLRLGTHVLLYPLYDPLHVVEFMSTLDVITKDRLEFGVGLGYRSQELEAFNIPIAERGGRLDEAITLTRRLWTEDSVTFNGKYYHYEGAFVSPKPAQKPHPPILVAGMAEGDNTGY